MDRVPGYAWLLALAAIVVVMVASAVPFASAPGGAVQAQAAAQRIAPQPIDLNPHLLGGAGALVVTGLLLLLFFYRRRLYILFWVGAWVLLAASMFVAGRTYASEQASYFAFGIAQFLGILSGLMLVVSADAYPTKPRVGRHYGFALVPLFLWFALAPLALGPAAVFAPGHVMMGGAAAVAGAAFLLVVRHTRMIGAAVVGVSLALIAASHVWIVFRVPAPDAAGATPALLFRLLSYLIAALGMQLMTFEDMTLELRRTNRRLEKAQGKLRRLVITDALTGCRNRRFFDEIIGRELQRHHRHGIPLSLLFVDIDRFKAVNDLLGHEVGDHVLRQVAHFLLSNIREADYVFRWGGDEFLVLISCREEEARRRAGALQRAFAESPDAATLPAGVGLSIGCAEVDPETDDVIAVIRMADERMYENKRAMRTG